MRENVLVMMVLVGGLGWLTSAMGTSPLYSVEDLGVVTELPGGNESKPYSINFQGEVAAANVRNGAYQALVYTGATWTNLGTLGGANSYAAAINDSNLVVGHSLTQDGSDHAFLWIPTGTNGPSANPQMMDLGTLGGSSSEAYAINRAGQITGYTTDAANDIHAFVYSSDTMVDIGATLSTLPFSYGYGINDSGHVAGTAYNPSYNTEHAFFYDGVSGTDLGSLGQPGASALALNNNDQVVGFATTSAQTVHAFRYFGGQMIDLGSLGGLQSYATGINNSNVVVGGANFDPTQTAAHAFMAISNSMVDLNNLLDSSGTGWTLSEARAISDSGLIVGLGVFGGANHIFLLRPVTTVAAPLITGIDREGPGIIISFTATIGAQYALQSTTNLLSGSWNDVLTNITATSRLMSATNAAGANQITQFYRLKVGQ